MSSRRTQTVANGPAVNDSRRRTAHFDRDQLAGTYKATTISFTAPGTIADSANGLGAYAVNDVIEVRGSALNSRPWTVTAAGAGSITVANGVLGASIQSEIAGPTIIIRRAE